MCCRKGVSLDG
ncbi:hypothetical protein F383_15633 [Gossypium arboreum]|uniref:Uncharacterized protein n=1 Tax=Gossypium arboreum TaxID=29729 RepID=A0A0B0Q2P7_GOSAR|nr:hypothetical protein F383_15633 [Gossypium arboreum]